MSETLEELRERTQERMNKQRNKVKAKVLADVRLNYTYLPKQLKAYYDHIEPADMFKLLQDGEIHTFGFILGIVADKFIKYQQLSERELKILQIPKVLFDKAVGVEK
jgi:hypothetical protein